MHLESLSFLLHMAILPPPDKVFSLVYETQCMCGHEPLLLFQFFELAATAMQIHLHSLHSLSPLHHLAAENIDKIHYDSNIARHECCDRELWNECVVS